MLLKRSGFLIFLLLMALSSSVALAEGVSGTESVAQQLASPGWEEMGPEIDEPMIVYSLHLIEFSSYMGGILDAAVELSLGSESQGGYSVVTDAAVLDWISEYPGTFQANLIGSWETRIAGSGYDAWLVTMGDKPVSVELEEGRVGNDEEADDYDQALKITMTPRQIDTPGEGVLTDIALDYRSLVGALGKARITTWIRPEAEQPLAVVVQEMWSDRHARRYFGLYAKATTMASSALPKSGPLVSIGNIRGLQGLLVGNTGQEPDWTKVHFGLGQRQGEVGLDLGLEFERNRYRVHTYLDSCGPDIGYVIGVDYGLYQELGLAVMLHQEPHLGAVLRLGLSDKVRWGENLELEAAYLPIAYVWGQNHLTNRPWLQFTLRVEQEDWGTWYECVCDDGRVGHGVGVEKSLGSDLDLRLLWSKTPADEDYYGISLVFRQE